MSEELSSDFILKEKKTLFDWKTGIGLVIGIFLAGVVSIISINSYLDGQAEKKYYPVTQGVVLQNKVENMEISHKEQNQKIDSLVQQQNLILIKVTEVSTKIDTISKK